LLGAMGPSDTSQNLAGCAISVAIVCKDNRATLGRTLESVAGVAGEVVAADSGSTDGTLELLEAHGARIIRTPWLGYAATKQLALERCVLPWVLSLDSDEWLTAPLREAIGRLDLGSSGGPTGYRVNRKVRYRGRFLEHAFQPEWRLRLVRRGLYRWGGLDPHDELVPLAGAGRTADLSGDLAHDSIESFASLLRKHVGHAELTAQSLHAAGRRAGPGRLAVSPLAAFVREAVIRRGYRDGPAGWAAAGAMAAYTLMKYVCLLELQLADAGRPGARAEAGERTPYGSEGGGEGG